MPLNTIVTDFVESHGYSLSSNGYCKLPSGLIIQWGTVATINGTVTVTLPITFPTQTLMVTGHEAGVAVSQTAYTKSDTITASTFQIVSNAASSFSWIAIGK